MVNLSLFVLPVFFWFFFFGHTTRHAELPPPGIEPVPAAVEMWSLNHWTTREFPLLVSSLKVCLVFFYSLY